MTTQDEKIINNEGESQTQETKKPTSRERALSYLSERMPDREFGEEDDLMEALMDAADEDASFRNKSNEVNKRLADLFEAEPDLYNIVSDALKGAPGIVAIARNITKEDLDAAMSSPEFENWDQNIGSRQKKLEDKRLAEEEATKNMDESMAIVEKYANDKGMTPEEAEAFYQKVDESLEPIYRGKISPEFLENMWKALNYEEQITKNRELGEAKVRNEKIITEKTNTGDAIPKLNSSSGEQPAPIKPSYLDKFKK